MTLYVNLAELLGTRIEQGFYRPGDRLPSVRALSVEHGEIGRASCRERVSRLV